MTEHSDVRDDSAGTPQRAEHLLTFRTGGYVLVIAGLVAIALVVWAVAPAVLNFNRAPGDGTNPETYGFDLSNFQGDRDVLVAGVARRDFVPVMDDPETIDGEWVHAQRMQRGKYLVSDDLVVGVVIDGVARAYPIMVVTNHEIINDELADTPIAVTFHPMTFSPMVYERRLNGESVRFGVSGLLHNACLLMYDRQPNVDDDPEHDPGAGASLWHQLTGRAVAGPRVGDELAIVTSQLMRWADWFERHPETTVARRDPAISKRYKRVTDGHERYLEVESIWHPVAHELPGDAPHPKSRVVQVRAGSERRTYLYTYIREQAGSDGTWIDRIGETDVRFIYHHDSRSVIVESVDDGAPIRATHALLYAWHAVYPEDDVRGWRGGAGAS